MNKEKDYFLENLATLFGASLDVIEALKALEDEMRTRRMKSALRNIRTEVESGYSLSKALERTNIFPEHVISLIRIGEETGRLPENLEVVALERAKDREFHSKIRGAMIYPGIVLTLTVVVGTGISWFILPRLANVFGELKVDLPVITKYLIAIGDFLSIYGLVVIPFLLVGFFLITFFIFFYSRTNFIGERILFVIPGTRKLLQEIELSRFGYVLGNLLLAGLPIVPALHTLYGATSSNIYRKLYLHLKENIEIGNSFAKSFESFPRLRRLLPTIAVQMVMSGERSGTLPKTFLKIGEIYGAKTELTLKNIAIILEPVLLIIVWLGVLAVAVAIILPIYSLIGGFNP